MPLYFLEDTCRVQGPKLADCLASGSTTECLKLPWLVSAVPCVREFIPSARPRLCSPLLLISAWGLWHNRRWGLPCRAPRPVPAPAFWGRLMLRSTCRMLATASDRRRGDECADQTRSAWFSAPCSSAPAGRNSNRRTWGSFYFCFRFELEAFEPFKRTRKTFSVRYFRRSTQLAFRALNGKAQP